MPGTSGIRIVSGSRFSTTPNILSTNEISCIFEPMKEPIVGKTDRDLIQELANAELTANHLYLYAASCALAKHLTGFVAYFDDEANNELAHWRKLRNIANDCGFELEMEAIDEVEFDGETIQDALNGAYKAEVSLMKQYEKAYQKADSVALKTVFQDFAKAQLEAVGEIADLIAEIDSVGVGLVNQRLLK